MIKAHKDKLTGLGLIFTIVSALICGALTWVLFDEETIARISAYLYDCGIDILGSFACAALYYGSMKQEGAGSKAFRSLIVMLSASFLVNVFVFFTTGLPSQRTINFTCILLNKLLDLVMIYYFYQYVRIALGFEGKLARWTDKGILILMVLQMIVLLVNVFYPITFQVDANGVYRTTEMAALEDVYLAIASVITTILIFRSKTPRNQKMAALTFIFLPLLGYAMIYGEFGNAANYGMILLSLIMMYCIIFNYNSTKLAATQADLDMATEIQTSMLPPAFPEREELDLYASMNTAKEVGGDFYDYFMIDDNHLCVVVADVSDKGMPAALFMMRATTTIKDHALTSNTTSEILTAVNARLCEKNKGAMFVTAWIGILDIQTMTMQYTNAGHNYPILQHKDLSCEELKAVHGLFLAGMRRTQYRQSEIKLEPGDRLLLFTDGVTEAHSAADELYGTERVVEVLKKTREFPGDRVLESILDDIGTFTEGVPQFDDITMVVLTIKEDAEGDRGTTVTSG